MKVMVFARPRKNVLHPESKAVLQTLHNLGFATVESLQVVKYVEITLATNDLAEAEALMKRAKEKAVLHNPNMQDIEFEYEPDPVTETA